MALHIGTLVGAVAYFRHDVVGYARGWARSIRHRRIESPEERLSWLIVAATIPGVLTGILAEGFIERELGQPWLIAVMLAVFGIVLYAVDRWAGQRRGMEDLSPRDAMIIGTAQALALSPGVSRSGVTITAARGLGLDRPAATRFSFLLSLPIIAGAVVVEIADLVRTGLPPGTLGPFVWGIVASAVSGYLVIWGLLAFLRRRSFAPFVWYRLAAAGLVAALIAANVRPATV